ncbi:hypothetical protein GCM10020001_055390 [Nonomuraea salmonea]
MVGLEPEPRPVRLDAQRLVRPQPRQRPPEMLGQLGPRHQEVLGRRGEHREVVGPRHLDPQHEPHAVEVVDQALPGAGLDVGEHGLAVVDQRQVVLHAALQVEVERLRPLTWTQRVELLRGQIVEPFQPVGAGDADDLAVAAVDDRLSLRQRALLGEQVAVVGGYVGVRRVGGDCAGEIEQRATHAFQAIRPAGRFFSPGQRQSRQRPNTVR